MAGFALAAVAVAVVTDRVMDKRGWSSELRVKFKILFVMVATQTLVTAVAPLVVTPQRFGLWS